MPLSMPDMKNGVTSPLLSVLELVRGVHQFRERRRGRDAVLLEEVGVVRDPVLRLAQHERFDFAVLVRHDRLDRVRQVGRPRLVFQVGQIFAVSDNRPAMRIEHVRQIVRRHFDLQDVLVFRAGELKFDLNVRVLLGEFGGDGFHHVLILQFADRAVYG